MRSDGLSINNTNLSYGGAVCEMRSTKIKEVEPHATTFRVRGEQSMKFSDIDDGPFWLTEDERIPTKPDRPTGVTQRREKLKAELLVKLRKAGVDTTKRRFKKSELLILCKQYNIPIFKN